LVSREEIGYSAGSNLTVRTIYVVAAVLLGCNAPLAQQPRSLPLASLDKKPVVSVRPDYPEAAKKAHIQGLVVLEIVIGTEGQIETVHRIRGSKELAQLP
jgi:outer membrane biosynthesis protein TonB